MTQWSTERFENLPPEKAARIVAAALSEFATHGYQMANTNRIAASAGISVGALFKYFSNKDDLFRHVIHAGSNILESHVAGIVEADEPTAVKIEKLLRLVADSSVAEREYVLLYHEATGVGNRELAHDLALEIESYTSAAYTRLMELGQLRGDVRDDIPAAHLAFLVDNILVSLQFSLACHYYQDRMERYRVDDSVIESALAFITSALRRQS